MTTEVKTKSGISLGFLDRFRGNKEAEVVAPYVVSQDVYGLMSQWAEVSGYILPPRDFFQKLSTDLKAQLEDCFGPRVEFVSEDDLRNGMNQLAAKSRYPVYSFDRAYVDGRTPNIVGYIDVTRLVDQNYGDLGLHGRDGHPFARSENYNPLFVPGETGDQPITLIDDVIFSGGNLAEDTQYLAKLHRPVKQIIAGIGIKSGVDKIRARGIEVLCVKEYPDVADEVCERDFFAGVPMSGRTVQDTEHPDEPRWSAPYFDPFGSTEWSSVNEENGVPPEKQREFALFCLKQSIKLWEAVETLSGKPVYMEIPPRADSLSARRLKGMDTRTSIVDFLKATLVEQLRGERSISAVELPRVIDTPYPYIALGDLQEVSQQLVPNIDANDVEPYQNRMFGIQHDIMPEGSTFYATSSSAMAKRLEAIALQEVGRIDNHVGVVQLDRYIASEINNPNFFRLNISRGNKDDIVSRPGEKLSPEEQFNLLESWIKQNGYTEIVLMDDVLAFATTLVPIIKDLQQRSPDIRFRVIVGFAASGGEWKGIEKVRELGIQPEVLTTAYVSPKTDTTSGMSMPTSRDMTVFGGYLSTEASGTDMRVSYPHSMPFTIPRTSFMDVNKRVDASRQLLDFNLDFMRFVESKLGRAITLNDLKDHGFAIPYTNVESIKEQLPFPALSTRVVDYLQKVQALLETNVPGLLAEAERIAAEEKLKEKEKQVQ